MGSPEFAVPALQALTSLTEVVGVVTQPDRPSGRGRALNPPPVKICAKSNKIPVIQPEKISAPDAFSAMVNWQPDILIVAAYGQILRKNLLALPRLGCLNLHASLLPRHRGAAPIAAAILAGDFQTGITLMQMDPGLDTGPILTSRSIPIGPEDTSGSLSDKLAALAALVLADSLPAYLRQELSPQPQDSALASYAPQLKKENGQLDFHQPAMQLERQIRAYFPWPGSFLLWKGLRMKVLSGAAISGLPEQGIGQVLALNGFPAIQCGQGILVLRTVQLPGKKPMSGNAFLLGNHALIGSTVT
jgi:methionyl-tRNA formyltransferase